MDNVKDKIKQEPYRNWVKSTLGLEQTKKAVQDYVEDIFKLYINGQLVLKPHQSFLSQDELDHITVGGSFRTNLAKSVQFKLDQTSQSQVKQTSQSHVKYWQWTSKDNCNGKDLCRSSFKKIATLHRDCQTDKRLCKEKVFWDNSNNTIGISLQWAIAKMFMPQGNSENKMPADTDPHAMFHLMIACDLFSNDIRRIHLDKLIEARNTFLHSADNTATVDQVKECFEHMECLLNDALNDKRVGRHIRDQLTADVAKLQKLETSEMTVSMFDDAHKLKRKQIYSEFEMKLYENDPGQLMELLKLAERNMADIKEINTYSEFIDELKNVDHYKTQLENNKRELKRFKERSKVIEKEDFFIFFILFVVIVFFSIIFRLNAC